MRRLSVLFRAFCAAAIGLAVIGHAAARAQGPALAEVAKKEADRRKKQPAAGKVYTNKDLPPSAQKPPQSGEAAPAQPVDPVAAATEQKPADPKPEGEAKDEGWWKNRITQAREELRRNEVFAAALQSRINALTRDYTNRDSPGQRRVIAEQRTEAVNELSRVTQDTERARKQIADIEEEARQAGVPPGWLR